MSTPGPVILWFRSDLRLQDHPAFHAAVDAAVTAGQPVIPVFVLDDRDTPWAAGRASRWWLHHSLDRLNKALEEKGSRLILRRGGPVAEIETVVRETGATSVFLSRSHEPAGRADENALRAAGLNISDYPGNVLFEPGTVLNGSGAPFKVFTPFYKACLAMPAPDAPLPAPDAVPAPATWPASDTLDDWALRPSAPDWAGGLRGTWTPGEEGACDRLDSFLDGAAPSYKTGRDRPDLAGTSRLSPHLHFGEVSARQIWHACAAHPNGQTGGGVSFLREVIWREFSAHLLHFFPGLPDAPLRPEFAHFPWVDDEAGFTAWTRGQTGYPIVDAGMRELWHTGWMHNRVRMIVASFLVKDLRIDWRQGEAWFWDTLVDADMANNAASWQWVAGCGTDASPYFRVFNPMLQARKFDPDGAYIRRWVPELAALPDEYLAEPWALSPLERAAAGVTLGETYPHPIVDHAKARQDALDALNIMKSLAA